MPTIPWRRLVAPQPDVHYVVMASRLPLRSYRTIPHFLVLAASVMRQLERTAGVVGYSLRAQPTSKTFWTLSAWTGEAELGEFVRTMPHLAVMGRLRPHMETTRFLTWTVLGTLLPIRWEDAIERLMGSTATTRKDKP